MVSVYNVYIIINDSPTHLPPPPPQKKEEKAYPIPSPTLLYYIFPNIT
jgi:hypothetical protein